MPKNTNLTTFAYLESFHVMKFSSKCTNYTKQKIGKMALKLPAQKSDKGWVGFLDLKIG